MEEPFTGTEKRVKERAVRCALSLAIVLLSCGGISSSPTDAGDAAAIVDANVVNDAGADAGPVCTRAAQATTASTSLFDALVSDLSTLADAQKSARVDQFIADVTAHGGTPLEDSANRLVFVVRGAPPQGPWSIAGAFTDWMTNPQSMTLVAGTDLYVLDAQVARGVAQPYKLLSGTDDTGFMEDLLARNVAWDGIDRGAPGEFNAIAHASDGDLSKGRIVRHHTIHSSMLDDDRDVFVYLPPRYDDGSCAPLPQIIFHDGNESLTRGDFAGVADTTYATSPASQSVLVFVALPNQDVRMAQYTFGTTGALGDEYGDFLAHDLAPIITANYRVCPNAASRGIAGASLGGLISTYLAFSQGNAWGFVGSQSGSYFWDDNAMITRASQDPTIATRFYLDTGCPDANDNCSVVQEERDALKTKGYEVVYDEDDTAQHDWPYWAERLPKLLADFPSTSLCE